MIAPKGERRASFIFGGGLTLFMGMVLTLSGPDIAAAQTPNQPAAVQDTVRGTVTDEQTGEPVAAVLVRVEGSVIQAVTDAEGNYALLAPPDGSLVFTRIGYLATEVAIAGRARVDVAIEVSAAELQQILVTGYSSQRRADITGAVSSVNMQSLGRVTSSSVLQRLSGNVSGVTVDASGSPGARSTVRIRGVSSFQNNDPLYIIDGTPVLDSPGAGGMGGGSGGFNFLNPNDIESIQVLKDASAASIYGSRANNGVVIIETKKGSLGAPRFHLDAKFGVATPVRGYDDFLILDALEYHEFVRLSHINAGEAVPRHMYGDPDNPSLPAYIFPNDGINQTMSADESRYAWENSERLITPASPGTNWWKAVFGPANVYDVNLRVSGGSDTERYNVGFNYFNQEGTAAYNRFQRGTVRVNTDFNIGRLTVGENLNISLDEHFGGMTNDPGGFAENTVVGKNVMMQPIVPIYDIGGNFASSKGPELGNHDNPLKRAWAEKDNVTRNVRMFGNAFARLDLRERVSLNTRFGFNLGQGSTAGFNHITPENSEPNLVYSMFENTNRFTDWTWTNTLNLSRSFGGQHNTDVLLGQEASKASNRFIAASMAAIVTTDINARYINDAIGDPATKNVNSSGGFSTLLSYFGKVDYNYAERYYASVTVRHDGSSRLGPTNRWGTFPAFNAGWRLSQEPLMAGSTFFTNLMLRFGWGVTGNQEIAAGRTVDQMGGSTAETFYDITGSGENLATGYRLQAIGNPDLKWEGNRSVNVGLDAEFFEGRVSLDLDVYQRDTDNLLYNPALPATAGFAAPPIVNVGKVRNRGVDFGIGYRGTLGREINWNVNFNGAHYKNEILRIAGDQEFFFGPVSTRFATQGLVINKVGHPIGAFHGLVLDGFFQSQEEIDQLNANARQRTGDPDAVFQDGAAPGRFRFRDLNGDGRVTLEDRTVIGDPHPDFTAGLSMGLQWRRWDLAASLFGTFGNDIFDVQKEFYVFGHFNSNVRRDRLTDSWTPENPNAKYPRIDKNDAFSGPNVSSFYVEDGSYVRLSSLQVGYTVPDSWIPGLGDIRVWVQGENLFTITGYSGLDPALPASNVSASGMDVRDQARGIDRGVYPTSRMITVGFGIGY